MPKHARPKHAPSTPQARPKHSEQLLGTYGNPLNLKKHEIFDLKKNVLRKERRTKQSLDSPQTIEAKNSTKFEDEI